MPRGLVLVMLLALPSAAAGYEFRLLGQPLRLDVTESLYLNYHGDDGTPNPTTKNYGELLSRLNAQLAWRRLLFGIRLDSAAYVHTPQPGDVSSYTNPDPTLTCAGAAPSNSNCVVQPNDYRIVPAHRFEQHPTYPSFPFVEKIFLSYAGRNVEATLGDFYVNLGRGLVLSIRKVDELGLDTTLRGAKVAVHEGDFSALALAGFANIQNVDEATSAFTPDPNDLIAALHADYRFFDRVLVGAHGVFEVPYALDIDEKARKPAVYNLRAGAMVDAPRLTDWLALYGEYARAEDALTAKKTSSGDAVYAAATTYFGPTATLFEFKYYDHYQPWKGSVDPIHSPVASSLVYQQPPTLERVITQLTDNSNIVAGRVRVDLRLDESLLLFASAELGQLRPTETQTDTLVDVYYGAELRWDQGLSHLFPLVGVRRETLPSGELEEQLLAIEWDAAQKLPRRLSLETSGLIWLRSKAGPEGDWREGNIYVSLKWSPWLIVAAGYEFTTISTESENQHNFFNGSITWNITPATSLQLFGGGQRSGLKCISGVCRVFPAFEGARLAFVLRL